MKLIPGSIRFVIQRITEHIVLAVKLFLTHMMKLILEENNLEIKRVCFEII